MNYDWENAHIKLKDMVWKYNNRPKYKKMESLKEDILLLQIRYNYGERSGYLFRAIMELK